MIGTSAVSEQGFNELIETIGRHRQVAFETETGRNRRLGVAEFRLRKTAENLLMERFDRLVAEQGAPLAMKLLDRRSDPYALANDLLNASFEREDPREQDARSKIAR